MNGDKILVIKPERRKPLGRYKSRGDGNTKMDCRNVGFRGVDWINLTHDEDRRQTLLNTVINL
jgi:hypothetical protein